MSHEWVWQQRAWAAGGRVTFDLPGLLGGINPDMSVDKGYFLLEQTVDQGGAPAAALPAFELPRTISETTFRLAGRCTTLFEAVDGPTLPVAYRLVQGRFVGVPATVGVAAGAGNIRRSLIPFVLGGRARWNVAPINAYAKGQCNVVFGTATPFADVLYTVVAGTLTLCLRLKPRREAGMVASTMLQTPSVGADWNIDWGGHPLALALAPLDQDMTVYSTISPAGGACQVQAATPIDVLTAQYIVSRIQDPESGFPLALEDPDFGPLLWPGSNVEHFGVGALGPAVSRTLYRSAGNTAADHRSVVVVASDAPQEIRAFVADPSDQEAIPDRPLSTPEKAAKVLEIAGRLAITNRAANDLRPGLPVRG